MEKEIIFREIHQGEEAKVYRMIVDCFNEFIAPEYSDDGVTEFEKYVEPNRIQKRLTECNFIIVALKHERIIGVIEVRSNNHIALLFVKKEHQHRGIAKKLLELAVSKCKQRKSDVSVIEVNSSPFAVPFYEKLGFMKVKSEQLVNGIRFTPMTLKLN
ncbi:MAG: GNAT family N-acetyltransferase [Candidatus Bathyarchaeota archaeon]|nr:GNAT family N-acetyltransferase [Candidatus Bathyarchaeota archaeon]